MLLLYAVVPTDWRPSSSADTTAGLSMLTGSSVALLYDERERPPTGEREELLAFGRVVNDLAKDGPLLPVRFGTMVESIDELREVLDERSEHWEKRLAVVRGHVEMLVHVVDASAPVRTPAAPGSGREYLLSRAGAHRHAEDLFEGLASAVAPFCGEVRRLAGSDELRVACLVQADAVDGFRSALDAWSAAQEGRQSSVTGPWPPFSFTEEEDS